MKRLLAVSGASLLALLTLGGCGGDDSPELKVTAPVSITLTSTAFADGASIPVEFTCEGRDVSPPLTWEAIPEAAATLVLVVDDPDAPGGTFDHWLAYDIPATENGLEQAISPGGKLPADTEEGKNGFGDTGYGGPCPPKGKSAHHYNFRLYALDTALNLGGGKTKQELGRAMEGHVLAQGALTGLYARP